MGLYKSMCVCVCVCVWASPVARLVKNPPAMPETWFDSWVGKIPWRKDRLPAPLFMGFPGGSDGRVCLHCRRPGFYPWFGKIP